MAASCASYTEVGEISSLLTPRAPPPWTRAAGTVPTGCAPVGRHRAGQHQGDEAGGDDERPER